MRSTRVLIAYGSKHGATQEIAEEIGEALRSDGIDAEVMSADRVDDVSDYDAVILGGAVYAGRWHVDARRCARRHAGQLRQRPVWLFSSGPVDDSAERRDIAPVRGVARWMQRLGAREHITFGGALTAETPGRIARSLVRQGKGGDFRNPERIRRWADHIATELTSST
ncbi:flavodoxin domain-containing protein [Streptomyces sp. ADI98-10]|uniref:flavodoxin domain-containing protein n=1 Tax=Streptomyces sp. ADI98-10 TaxID=1522763 RepID=UPI000F5505C6|nr:flavodoxin domain-containing protein [Streptomyces sp. ADI98-10]RPK80131.1 Protoporphyrinogen IX dehydrogenase [menaquinone] [Streptomyces sp. ADI98-10]